MDRVSVNEDQLKMYILQSKNEIMIKVDVNVNNYLIRVPSKIIIFGKLVHVIASMIKRVKLVNI